jgi:UDP-N-acetylmuramoyl-L-alanyl-D-glutamate--2,6-diaminopimelate ligase
MLQAGCRIAVVEVSSHALVLHRVANMNFKAGLFTNFSRDHLDFHNTMEEYLLAKKQFLDKLIGKEKSVAVNIDVKEFAGFLDDVRCNLITYSTEGRNADVYLKDIRLYPDKSIFKLAARGAEHVVSFRLPGRYNLANATGVAAVAIARGIDLEIIVRGLESADPVPGRFQPVNMDQPFSVIIDYAHTPDAVERLCLSAREITAGRMMILFGCGGDRDRGKRPLMAEAATRHSDFAVITSDNPRTEDPLEIIEDMKPGLVNENYKIIPDRREAIEAIIKMAEADDTILIAGKGAEDYQEIGNKRYPFDDRIAVVEALKALGYAKG